MAIIYRNVNVSSQIQALIRNFAGGERPRRRVFFHKTFRRFSIKPHLPGNPLIWALGTLSALIKSPRPKRLAGRGASCVLQLQPALASLRRRCFFSTKPPPRTFFHKIPKYVLVFFLPTFVF